MKTKVTVMDKDRGFPISSYETEKEGEDFDKELNLFQAKIATEYFTPFRFQTIQKVVIAGLLLLLMIGGVSCRSVKKSKSSSDSTVSRTVEAASNWATEVITEFIPFSNASVSIESGLPVYPVIPVLGSSTAVSPVKQYQAVIRQTSLPGYFRQTIRAKGETTNKVEEDKQATIKQETKSVESGITTNPIFTGFQIGLILSLIFLIVILGIIKRVS